MHISPSNKYYIGITSQTAEQRWRKGKGYKTSVKFYKAIQKYGWDNFKHIILFENLNKEIANEIEKYLISKYNTINDGYNITEGGYTSNPKMSTEERRKSSKRNQKIYRYNLDGKYIDMFFSMSEAERQTWVLSSSIGSCANGKISYAGGYMWRKRYYRKIEPYVNPKEKQVFMYDINKKLIKKFQSVKKASLYSGYTEQEISKCCKREIDTLDENIFLYKESDIEEIEINEIHYKGHISEMKNVYQYSFDGKLLNSFESLSSASRDTGDTISMISSQCNNETKMSTRNYYYTFEVGGNKKISKYDNQNKKGILQFDLNGVFIKQYSSIVNASNVTGININCIVGVLKGRHKTAGGYQWRYINDNEKIFTINNIKKTRKINQYDRSMNLLKTWNSISEAANELGLCTSGIIEVCKGGKQKTSGGYIWEYTN